MTKTVSILLALALVLSLAIPALADDRQADVTATYIAGHDGGVVYNVDVTWDGLSFIYNGASKGDWDPVTHTYTGASAAGWAEGNGTITITNHSNAAITAEAAYKAAEGFDAVGVDFGGNNVTIGSADNGEGENGAGLAKSAEITVTPKGTLPENNTGKAVVVGTITVTIQ